MSHKSWFTRATQSTYQQSPSKVRWWSADNRNACSNRWFDENLTEKSLWCRLTLCTPLELISLLPISTSTNGSLAVDWCKIHVVCKGELIYHTSNISPSDTHNTCSQIFMSPPNVIPVNLKLKRKHHDIWWPGERIRSGCLGWQEGIPTTHTRYYRGNSEEVLLARLV